MLSSLFRRNVLLMMGLVLAGQILAGLFVLNFVMQPQIERVAAVTADMILGMSESMNTMTRAEKDTLLSRFEKNGDIAIRRKLDEEASAPRFPNYFERRFIIAMGERLYGHQDLDWRKGDGNRLWFRLDLGGEKYWVSATPPTQRSALASLIYAFGAAFLVAVVAGYMLQRRLDAPLRRLAAQVEIYDPVRDSEPVDVSGPDEIAAVGGAFNRMAERLRRDDAERSLMLGGVSHDLRTPLTRLRLCLEMMRCNDPELEKTANRQVDRIEAMLEQFLDFSRGFEDEEMRTCDLGRMLSGVVSDRDPDGLVEADLPDGLLVPIRPIALSRAVSNLLGNALRHGSAPFRVDLHAKAGADTIEIVITDSGEGFDAEQAAQLTRPFARGNSARGGDGAGLGLAIVERVALAHGGGLAFQQVAGGFRAILTVRATKPV